MCIVTRLYNVSVYRWSLIALMYLLFLSHPAIHVLILHFTYLNCAVHYKFCIYVCNGNAAAVTTFVAVAEQPQRLLFIVESWQLNRYPLNVTYNITLHVFKYLINLFTIDENCHTD